MHLNSKNMAEVAMAKLHIAALMAEYLRKRGNFTCFSSFHVVTLQAASAVAVLSYNQERLCH